MFFNNLRSGLRTASHISYLLGVLSIVLALSLSLVNFPVMAQNVSGASLVASGGCSGSCTSISATFTNHGSGDMTESVVYEVQSRVDGAWIVVDSGTLGPLASGESQTVTYNPNNVSGTYRFKAYQPAGHPGTGVLYSSSCKIECVLPSPTPVIPTSTPVTPTATPVTPTSTPVTPTFTPTFTSTPVTATPQEPTPTPQEPTNTPTFTSTPVTPTATPITPTSTPVTATPQEPTPTPQEPTSTPSNPTETPVVTNTPVTATPQEPTPTPQEPTSTPVTATPQEPTPQDPTSTPSNPTETPVVTNTPVTATPQEPTPTPQEPGTTPQEPTKVVTQVPPTKVPTLGVPSVVDQPSVLIPVTGGDMSPVSPLEAAQKVAFNLGLGFVGLGLVLQGLRRRF